MQLQRCRRAPQAKQLTPREQHRLQDTIDEVYLATSSPSLPQYRTVRFASQAYYIDDTYTEINLGYDEPIRHPTVRSPPAPLP